MTHGLAEHGGGDPLRRPFDELHGEGAADAVSDEEELVDAEMVHQRQLIVGEGSPRVIRLDRPA